VASVAAPHVNWARQAVSDERGQVDVAYVSIMLLVIMACLSVTFILVMSVVSYVQCAPITTITQGGDKMTSVVPCNYDPLPTGQAVGLIFGAFATIIGALGVYMGLTRRRGTRGETIDVPPPAPA